MYPQLRRGRSARSDVDLNSGLVGDGFELVRCLLISGDGDVGHLVGVGDVASVDGKNEFSEQLHSLVVTFDVVYVGVDGDAGHPMLSASAVSMGGPPATVERITALGIPRSRPRVPGSTRSTRGPARGTCRTATRGVLCGSCRCTRRGRRIRRSRRVPSAADGTGRCPVLGGSAPTPTDRPWLARSTLEKQRTPRSDFAVALAVDRGVGSLACCA